MKIVIISGTPGTGKTSVSKKISELYNVKFISLNKLAISNAFNFPYDNKRDTIIIDDEKFIPYVIKKVEKIKEENPGLLIIEGHFSDIIPSDYYNYIIVLRCDPDILTLRLRERGYKQEKINENVQSEILGNCVNYFIQKEILLPIYEINTSKLSIEVVAEIIIEKIVKNDKADKYKYGKIDWLEKLFQENRMDEFFD